MERKNLIMNGSICPDWLIVGVLHRIGNISGEIVYILLICILPSYWNFYNGFQHNGIYRECILIKISKQKQFGNISSVFGFSLYWIRNWSVLVCLQNNEKLMVPLSF